METIKITVRVLKDIINGNGVLIDKQGELRDVVVEADAIENYDDCISAVESRYLETYSAVANFQDAFEVVNSADICDFLDRRDSAEAGLAEIHDMLIDYMGEDAAGRILEKISAVLNCRA